MTPAPLQASRILPRPRYRPRTSCVVVCGSIPQRPGPWVSRDLGQKSIVSSTPWLEGPSFPGVGHLGFARGYGLAPAGSELINPALRRPGRSHLREEVRPIGYTGCLADCPLAPGWGPTAGASVGPGVGEGRQAGNQRQPPHSLARDSRSTCTTSLLCSAPPAVLWPATPSRRPLGKEQDSW